MTKPPDSPPVTMDGATFEYIPLNKLNKWAKNPRDAQDGAARLARLIVFHGFIDPMTVSADDNVIRAGHTRYEALRLLEEGGKLGEVKYLRDGCVPCRVIKFPSEAEAEAYAISNNQADKWVQDDFARVADILLELDAIDEFDMDATGFDADELKQMMNWTPDADHKPKAEKTGKGSLVTCPECGAKFPMGRVQDE